VMAYLRRWGSEESTRAFKQLRRPLASTSLTNPTVDPFVHVAT
jgi:hypothetical protein